MMSICFLLAEKVVQAERNMGECCVVVVSLGHRLAIHLASNRCTKQPC